MDIRDIIRAVASDGRVTGTEWSSQLAPAVGTLPARASEESRALLELWASDSVRIDFIDRMGMARALMRLGYAMPPVRPEGASAAELVQQLVRDNVSERDAELERLSAATGRTSGNVTISVIDGGIDTSHDALQAKLWTNAGEVAGDGIDNDGNGRVDDVHGWDFADGDGDVRASGHGTHVTGIATRGTDRVQAIASRVHVDTMNGAEIAGAIDYAAAHGAQVMNLSFGVDTAEALAPVIEAMRRHPEVLFVKSAGNKKLDLRQSDPAKDLSCQQLPNLLVVSSSNADGSIASDSNYGAPFSTHAARGTSVMSAIDGNTFMLSSGTSMAAPNISSAAARMLLLDERLSPQQLNALLAETSDRAEAWTDLTASGGLLNAERAMRAAAMTGLLRSGLTADEAADRIGLQGDERARLMNLAAKYAE